jgi:putative endopeptidase
MSTRSFRHISAFAFIVALCFTTFAQSSGFDPARMDRTVEACEDFFQYANGSWLRNTQIPASEARWGTFNILADSNNSILKQILDNAAKNGGRSGSDAQMIGDFYSTCMDEAAIEKAGIDPIKPLLKNIDDAKSLKDLQEQIAEMHNAGRPAIFTFGAGPDLRDSNVITAITIRKTTRNPLRYAKDS